MVVSIPLFQKMTTSEIDNIRHPHHSREVHRTRGGSGVGVFAPQYGPRRGFLEAPRSL
jgi:hypothetical protein